MKKKAKLSSSLEDYLEAILILERKNRVARVKDISAELNVTMPSVTGALKNLNEQGLINYEKNSFINLTDEGIKIAESILNRHKILMRFFTECLKLEGDWVEPQACSIEHAINQETAVRISNLTDWINKKLLEEEPLDPAEWIKILTE